MKPITQTHPRILAAVGFAASVAFGCASGQPGEPTMSNPATIDASAPVEQAAALLQDYAAALNQADVGAVMALYAPDAVFMAQHRPPAVGQSQIETAYREIFGIIRLSISFEVDEIVMMSPTAAYARTRSTGKARILANDTEVSEGNQELFVLVRPNPQSTWKIGRYIFSTTQPPRG